MYDIETLRYLNELAYRRFLEHANQGSTEPAAPVEVSVKQEPKEVKPAPVFPLAILARKLLGGPPSLAYYIELVEMSDTYVGFLNLVRDYLPAYEADIMAEDLDRRAQRFCQIFSETQFPLSDYATSEEITLNELLEAIPVQPMGAVYETFHQFTALRPGYIVALSLVWTPFETEDTLDAEFYDDELGPQGGRVPILEHMRQLVGEGLAKLIPDDGWPPAEIHEKTDGTEFDGLGHFADWIFSNTGCFHLDVQGEQLETGDTIEWGPDNVVWLTDDWENTREILDKIHRVALFLEEDLDNNFRNLLGILLDRSDIIVPKEQLRLPIG